MQLEDTRQYLGWPRPEEVTHPVGGGPGYYAHLMEQKTLSDRSARPASADIGFVLRANPRIRWAVETKVLHNPGDIVRYLDDLEKHLTGKSSPLSTQAALGAYLIQGRPDDVFPHLASALETPLRPHPAFPGRPHRMSEHYRDKNRLPAATPAEFVCHHLVFSVS